MKELDEKKPSTENAAEDKEHFKLATLNKDKWFRERQIQSLILGVVVLFQADSLNRIFKNLKCPALVRAGIVGTICTAFPLGYISTRQRNVVEVSLSSDKQLLTVKRGVFKIETDIVKVENLKLGELREYSDSKGSHDIYEFNYKKLESSTESSFSKLAGQTLGITPCYYLHLEEKKNDSYFGPHFQTFQKEALVGALSGDIKALSSSLTKSTNQ